jgi:hypothetical protein
MKQSNFLSLNWGDLGKGLLIAILATVFNWLQETFIPALNVSPEIKVLLVTAIAYLTKNFFQGNKPQSFTSSEDNELIGQPFPTRPKK